MQINYDFPWYLQNSEGFMTLYEGLYNTAVTISPISLLAALDIEHATTAMQLKFVATLYGLRSDWVGIEQALIYNVNNWSVDGVEENYWSGLPADTFDLLKNYIKAKVQMRNKNLTLQNIKNFFAVCLAHREFDPDTAISVAESLMHFDLTVTLDEGTLGDMVTLLSIDPYPFGKPTGISYTINYILEE
jgi:hypothetical protein